MKLQIINFITAKLANEKNLPILEKLMGYTTCFYRPSTGTLLHYGRTGKGDIKNLYYAPNQALLQKWLREKHEIAIVIVPFFNKWSYALYQNNKMSPMGLYYDSSTDYKTYEEALEDGLQKTLKLIKND